MPFGVPRSESERLARHQSIFGADTLPPEIRQRLGPSMSTLAEVLWSIAPCFPIVNGQWYPPIPRFLAAKIWGAGRRLE